METPRHTPDTTTEQPLFLAAPGMSDALLYENLSRMLLHMARGLTRTLQDAEDLVQQTLAKLWVAQTRGASKESVVKMARTTLTRTWIDGWRPTKGRGPVVPLNAADGDDARAWEPTDTNPESEPVRAAEIALLREDMAQAIAALPAHQQHAVIGRGVRGRTDAELGAESGISADTQKKRAQFGYRALRDDPTLVAWHAELPVRRSTTANAERA